MNNKIYKRVLKEAKYIIDTKCTIREIAKKINISKSTVHNDLHERLIDVDRKLYLEVKKILDYHASIKHINGGIATKNKYKKLRKG